MTQIFDDWTAYDDWLIENYSLYNIYEVNEVEGKIHIEYCNKGELNSILEKNKKAE
ncbi:MAG: hypothetical protein MJ174_01710 [Treponema sp.]|nr:hypothetical protein [Treponema sp.]